MKQFYTRKEVDEEISKALYERDRERDRDQRMDCMWHDFRRLEERVERLEMRILESRPHMVGCGGQGTPVHPELCNSTAEERK